ncbi:MAG TPA: exodeoxyribonuclease VII large subunit [Tepidisphaeraceae bacterium]|nr:exodeoxyribonuclease VII large subunit [Tepidisphaeraceae bacterium]
MSFFDFQEKIRKPVKADNPAGKKIEAISVSQLTSQIENAIKTGVPGTVHVKGEVSNLNLHRASGHLYFTLKDASACIDCVMFRSDAEKLKFKPADGIELLVNGRVAVYPQRGRYQLYATSLQPLGKGALELAFQQLVEKLKKEGLFDPARRKALPRFPTRIAIVTSRATAALQDILKVLRRFSWLQLYVYHVPVQGEGSAEQIADAIRHLNQPAIAIGKVDLILLGRGGGSLEDLWEFNEEIVARAMAASNIPIVTGIGHEVDISIADLVADYHAHTPTEAAQIVIAGWKNVTETIRQAGARLVRDVRVITQDSRQRLNSVQRHEFFRRPTDRINQLRQLLDDRQRSLQLAAANGLRASTSRLARLESTLVRVHPRHVLDLERQKLAAISSRLDISMQNDLANRSRRLLAIQRHLDAISPQGVLQRGYSITTRKKDGAIIRAAGDLRVGDKMVTRFADGTVESTVEDQKQMRLFE